MDATKGSRIGVLLYAILCRDIPSKLFSLAEELNKGISRFALLHCERPSLGSIKQIRNIVVRVCNLTAILNP